MKKVLIVCMILTVTVIFVSSVFAQEKAADFTLSSLTGESVTLSSFAGKEHVLVVFGATWCPYCVEEIPALNALEQKYAGKGLKILSVDIQESVNKVQKLADKKAITYTVLLDEKGAVAKAYGVRGIPDNVLVDKNGNIVYRGHLDVQQIESHIQ